MTSSSPTAPIAAFTTCSSMTDPGSTVDRTSWPRTLVAGLERTALRCPEKGFTLFDRRGRALTRCRFPELLRRLQVAAGRYQEQGIVRGDRVLVCLGTGIEWFEGWFGAILAGGVPIAMAPPEGLGSSRATIDKIDVVCESTGARWVITTAGVKAGLIEAQKASAAITQVYDDWSDMPATEYRPVHHEPEDVAFMQLTSGSTGLPRAVMIQHRAAIHNTFASMHGLVTGEGNFLDWGRAVISWLPLHHDMGLVSAVLIPILHGVDGQIFSPRAFLSKPRLWLDAISGADGVLAAAPNFAYQSAVDRLSGELEGLDLRGWRTAMFGAEMVNPETVEAFTSTFGAVGFSPAAVRPCYGMAETTVAVTMDQRMQGARTRRVPPGAGTGEVEAVVSLGEPVLDTELRVVAPDGTVLGDDRGGLIQVRTPSLFAGYFNDPEATAEVLGSDGWLDTGDIGFQSDGELYVTGRQKEILIVRGQNIMPHEIEWIAEELAEAGGSLRCGAFSVPGREAEQAVLVTECRGLDEAEMEKLEQDLRSAVGRRLGLPLGDVVFVRRGQIPKTTSGKVQRRELRSRYLEKELERL